jgi:hypothetical protein
MAIRSTPSEGSQVDSQAVSRGTWFVERARRDPWHANILIQLAELAGEQVPSLPGYIDRLLAVGREWTGGCAELGEPAGERARYLRWFAELGGLRRIR